MSEREGRSEFPAPASRPSGSRRGLLVGVLLGLGVVLVLVVNVLFNRLTPYTSETTLRAPVIGVAPNISGDIVEVLVRDNQAVQAGDAMFRIDPRRYEAAVAQAEAALLSAGQQVGASTAAIGAVDARLLEARANLDNVREQTRRTIELVERGVYPTARRDEANARLAAAEAGVQAAAAQAEEARRRLGPAGDANPAIAQARASLSRAMIDLAATNVVAPVDGIVTNFDLAPGQFASQGRTAATVIDLASSWLVANLPENNLGNVRPGDRVEIVLDALPGRILHGEVESIAGGVDQTIGASLAGDLPRVEERRRWLRAQQRIPVRIRIEEDTSALPVRVGSRAAVVIHTGRAGPVSALAALWIRLVGLSRFAL
jgi:multidrug resistance efflux pump